jgi:uncharacterized membrane protein YfcA
MIGGRDAIALIGAGVLVGAVGSADAITSLVSYPALLLAGLPVLEASVSNNVALVGSVDWLAGGSLALGMFVGSNLGPRLVRRVPAKVLRVGDRGPRARAGGSAGPRRHVISTGVSEHLRCHR